MNAQVVVARHTTAPSAVRAIRVRRTDDAPLTASTQVVRLFLDDGMAVVPQGGPCVVDVRDAGTLLRETGGCQHFGGAAGVSQTPAVDRSKTLERVARGGYRGARARREAHHAHPRERRSPRGSRPRRPRRIRARRRWRCWRATFPCSWGARAGR